MKAPIEDASSPSFYFPDFFLKSQTPWFVHKHSMEVSPQELQLVLSPHELAPKVSLRLNPLGWHNSYQPLFLHTFEQLQAKFASREIDKAVPFVLESTLQTMDEGQLRTSLLSVLNYAKENPAYVYGFWDKNSGILGATPEILFRIVDAGTKLETMACAGTKNLHSDSAAFLSDPKELHEHQLVVQGITESLAAFGHVHVGDLRLLKLSQLVHLVTPIAIELNATPSFEAIVRALHPTPAVGAFPRKEGMRWLEDYHTKIDRGRFGAPVGYTLPAAKKANCYVSIRNVQWNESEMMLAAGCGLVKESRSDREWAEISLKLQAIKEMLAL